MVDSLTENPVDLLAGMHEENSIPSGEDTTGVNLKRKLGTGNSAGYSDVGKRVQFDLNEREDDVSELPDDDGNGSNTNNNAVNSHKNDANSHENDESAGPLVSHKRPGSTHHGGSHSSEHSVSESSSNSSGFTPLPQPCELFLNDTSEEHYNRYWAYINLSELQSSEDVCVVNKVILFEVLYYILAKQDSKVEYSTRSGKTSHATFERMLFAMDLNARKGMNVGVFLLGKKQNAEIFTSCLNQRDTSAFGKNYIKCVIIILVAAIIIQSHVSLAPGALFTVENPSVVQKWMANGTLPLIFTAQSIKSVLHENKMYRIPPVPQSKSQHGFILLGVQITLLGIQVTNINCGGAMCDGLNMYNNSVAADRCPCYNVLDREGKICLVLSLKVCDRKDNINFCVHNHTSKSLTQLFMRRIPKGAIAATITGNQNHFSNLSGIVIRMLAWGNDGDGFDISGWTKRGTIADSGVVQSPTASKWDKPQQVDSGGLTYHLTRIAYSTPPTNTMLQAMQFDGNSLG